MNKIIIELIPSHSDSKIGDIIQLSALKLDGNNICDRFDYRLNEDLVNHPDLKDMFSYDKENFTYLNSSEEILDKFKDFAGDKHILYIDELALSYLSSLSNKKESVFDYINTDDSKGEDKIQQIITKHNLKPSNYIVDLVYEAYCFEQYVNN